ncbi:MAG: rod shape-determining protein [Patescibacteria group bacterium]
MSSITGLKERVFRFFSNDIGIDLGTANTLVYLRGKGVVIDEPSVVAVNNKTDRVIAIGSAAREMLGRTPGHINAERPVVDGVISNFEVCGEMIAYMIRTAEKLHPKLLGPRVIVGVPSGVTNVETRAVRDAATDAGAREVYIIEEPMAAAIGDRLPVNSPQGTVMIDIGGGTSDIAVISLGGIVNSKNIKIAGDKFNQDVMAYMRDTYKILIGEKTAERLKIEVGEIAEGGEARQGVMRGRDLISGLPREIIITDKDIKEAMASSIETLVESIKEVIETTPPEIISDTIESGIYLSGGGALISGLDQHISNIIQVPVHIVADPLTAVARGTGVVLEHLDEYKEVLVSYDNELPITY